MLESIFFILDPWEKLKHPGMSEGGCSGGLSLLPDNHTLRPGCIQPVGKVGGCEPVIGVQPDHRANISKDSLYDKRSICAEMEGADVGRPRGKVKGVEGTCCGVAVLFQNVTVILGKAKVKDKEGGVPGDLSVLEGVEVLSIVGGLEVGLEEFRRDSKYASALCAAPLVNL